MLAATTATADPSTRGQLEQATAARLRHPRLSQGLGLHRAAHLTGITAGYLSRLERGLRRPSHRVADQLATALHLDPDLAHALHAEARPDPEGPPVRHPARHP
jgi:transcriptional regulator with XRE-family HTH domain